MTLLYPHCAYFVPYNFVSPNSRILQHAARERLFRATQMQKKIIADVFQFSGGRQYQIFLIFSCLMIINPKNIFQYLPLHPNCYTLWIFNIAMEAMAPL